MKILICDEDLRKVTLVGCPSLRRRSLGVITRSGSLLLSCIKASACNSNAVDLSIRSMHCEHNESGKFGLTLR